MADSSAELQEMQAREIDVVCKLIADAMNADATRWARETFAFHFNCRAHGLDDGRAYFTYRMPQRLLALAGLHHYAWGRRTMSGWPGLRCIRMYSAKASDAVY